MKNKRNDEKGKHRENNSLIINGTGSLLLLINNKYDYASGE